MLFNPVEIVAADLFCLCCNRACVDGDKPVALATRLVLLSKNGMLQNKGLDVDEWKRLTREVASGGLNRLDLMQRLRMLLDQKLSRHTQIRWS